MPTLICGSMAFDTIMVFPDRFKNYILPDQIDNLNVCFVNPELRREYGGCAGNIAYSLKLLGGEPIPMATVGKDFEDYRRRLQQNGIPDQHVVEIPSLYTAQCFITTDQDNNQITAFHPGAMGEAHQNKVADAANISSGIVAPDGRDAMLQHSRDFAALGIPFMFDPGQNLPLFSKDELLTCIDQATWCVMNDYESQLMMKITELTLDDIASQVHALIVTRGGEGSRIYAGGKLIDIPAASIQAAVDPTGCGDAFRAGLLYGLNCGWDWETSGRVASLVGAFKVESQGTQNHHFTEDQFQARFEESFGYPVVT